MARRTGWVPKPAQDDKERFASYAKLQSQKRQQGIPDYGVNRGMNRLAAKVHEAGYTKPSLPAESEHDRIMRLRGPVECGDAIFVEGTNDSTHCEPCNGGCPNLCKGWAHRLTPEGRHRHCATWEDRRKREQAGVA